MRLDFNGKGHIYGHHLSVPYSSLVADTKRSVLDAVSNLNEANKVIHGDNLLALKSLLPHYKDKVDCIYIDPPYNTGKGDWEYNDNVNSPLMQNWFKTNRPVDGEDLQRHDKWMCMMWPRLQLLRELLSFTGAIAVSIDDNEHHHLRCLLDEVFGEENFVADISWQSLDTIKNDAKLFSSNCEHILVYAKDRSQLKINEY